MFRNIFLFIKSLSFIDYVLFFTVIFLIVLIVCLIYFIKINAQSMKEEDRNLLNDPDNLQVIAQNLSNKEERKPIEFTSYEKEQEDRAIISYNELLNTSNNFKFNYDEERDFGDLHVKKFDLNNLISPTKKKEEQPIEVHLISLEKEEAFLRALKELQIRLN